MAFGAGESRVAELATAGAGDHSGSGDSNAREEAYKSLQRVANEKRAEEPFPAGNPFDLIARASGDVEKNGKLTLQSRADYESAIKAADAMNRASIADQIKLAEQALQKAYPKEKQDKVALLEQQRDKLLSEVPNGTQLLLGDLLRRMEIAKTSEEQAQLKATARELIPAVFAKQDEIDAVTAEPRAVDQQLQVLHAMHRAPAIARFAYAHALTAAGEKHLAAPLLAQIAEGNPDIVSDPAFRELAKAVGYSANAQLDNPYAHVQAAQQAADAGNAKTAEGEWRKAIAAADMLPMQEYLSGLEKVEAALKVESDRAKKDGLLRQKAGLEDVLSLPVTLRLEGAKFYLQNAKPVESKQLLEEAASKDPRLKSNETYKQLLEMSETYSPGVLSSTVDFLKKSGKEIVSDLGAGTAGLVATSIIPGGTFFKVGAGLLAGGLTKHGLNMALGVDSTLKKDMFWGGVDALAFMTGAGVRKSLMGRMEAGLGKETLEVLVKDGGTLGLKNLETREATLLSRQAMLENAMAGRIKDPTFASTRADIYRLSPDQLFSRAMTDAEKVAIKQGLAGSLSRAERSALESVLANNATAAERKLLSDRLAVFGAQQQSLALEKTALEQQIAKLTGPNAPVGLEGLSAATELLTKGVAGKREIAAAELKQAVAQAPWWQKPILWGQGHAPLVWRLPNESLAGFQTAQKEFLAARGNPLSTFNLRHAFRPVEELRSLKEIKSHTFWKRYAIDGASVGATSVVFRGFREGDKVGTVDAKTGEKYSLYDAVTNTVTGSVIDSATGAFMIAGARSIGGVYTRFSGAAGEINARPAPTLAPNASTYGQLAHSVKLAKYTLRQELYKPIGDALSTMSMTEGSFTTRGIAAALTGVGLFSPKLNEIPSMADKAHQYEDILKDIEKPLVDAHPKQSDMPSR